jgi:ADP-L-glycero-D-manno-heptose 6-epimerase
MKQEDIIVITGAAGFIGSCLVSFLNQQGFEQLILVDDFSCKQKAANLKGKKYLHKIHREQFFEWAGQHKAGIQYLFHLGARTDTTEMDYAVHKKWNLDYSKNIWELCTAAGIPLLYASSAATYGNGALGYKDDPAIVPLLKPLNPYGQSKNDFDIWVLEQKHTPPFWAGVKFFNVYGPNEYHKGRMASVVFHAYNQIRQTGHVNLFRSHNPQYQDGQQLRDFIYVTDVLEMITWLMRTQPASGLYNIGTGKAETFLELVQTIFKTLHIPQSITFIDTPADIRDKYQYFTQADMTQLHQAGYRQPALPLAEGVRRYVAGFLETESYY